jgi:hypothetical protein
MFPVRQTLKSKAVVVGPLGHCMYGPDHNKDELTREHIIPRGLGGGVIMLAGSCEDCRKKTQAFETECLRVNWGLFRNQIDMEISKKSNPVTHAVMILVDGETRLPLIVPIKDYPTILTLPKMLEAPGIFSGRPAYPVGLTHIYNAKEAGQSAAKYGITRAAIQATYNIRAFYQLLAKIAHGMMLVNFHMEIVRALLLDIILEGDMAQAPNLIGATAPIAMPSTRGFPVGFGMHQVRCDILRARNQRFYIIVDICLFPHIPFARLPTPTYRVIAGEMTEIPAKRSWLPPI